MSEWEKRAAWYNQGIFDIHNPDPFAQEAVNGATQYLNIIWSNMEGIRKFDLLGIQQGCSCGTITPLPTFTPYYIPLHSASTATPPYVPIITR